MNCEKKGIDEIYDLLNDYPNMRKINFSFNKLNDISSVTCIKFLTTLNISNNEINSLDCFNLENELNFLETLDVSSNKIQKLTPIQVPSLKKLSLNSNQINSCEEFLGHRNL